MFAAIIFSSLVTLAQNPAPESSTPASALKPPAIDSQSATSEDGNTASESSVKTAQGSPAAAAKPKFREETIYPEPKPVLVKGGGVPQFSVVEGIKDRKLMVREKNENERTPGSKTLMKVNRKTWEIDGQKVTQTFTHPEQVKAWTSPTVVNAYDLDSVLVYDLNGVKIEKQRWAKIFANPSLALVARSDRSIRQEIDPAFLKAARDGVPFVILPQQPRPQADQAHAPNP